MQDFDQLTASHTIIHSINFVGVVTVFQLVVPVDGVLLVLSVVDSQVTALMSIISCRYKFNWQSKCLNILTCHILLYVHQVSGGETFENVCPLLDLSGGTTNYTQHVRVQTDLQLTARNLLAPVRQAYIIYIYRIYSIRSWGFYLLKLIYRPGF